MRWWALYPKFLIGTAAMSCLFGMILKGLPAADTNPFTANSGPLVGRRRDRVWLRAGGIQRQEGPAPDWRHCRRDPVKDGDLVHAGDVVLRLDDTVTRSMLGVVRSQLDELQAREARLIAERDDTATASFPDDVLTRPDTKSFAATMAAAERLLESRRAARTGQRDQLRERVAQSNEEIRGLSAQQDAKEVEIGFIADELVGVRSLYAKNLVSISRLMLLQRDKALLEGERGQLIAEIARARQD
jgi:multidrug efflux pump subunit AcrA (membrane-fusion protein)